MDKNGARRQGKKLKSLGYFCYLLKNISSNLFILNSSNQTIKTLTNLSLILNFLTNNSYKNTLHSPKLYFKNYFTAAINAKALVQNLLELNTQSYQTTLPPSIQSTAFHQEIQKNTPKIPQSEINFPKIDI